MQKISRQPTFIVVPEYIGRDINVDLLRLKIRLAGIPSNRPSEVQAMSTTIRLIKANTYSAYARINRNLSKEYINNNIKGWLEGHSLRTSVNHIQPRSVIIGSLNVQMLQDIMFQIHESNEDVSFYDIEWSFVIDRNSARIGNGAIKRPEYAVSCTPTWENYIYKNQPINCAAYAITFLTNYKKNKESLIKPAAMLQEKLGWSDYISIADLEDYIKINPQYRITCFMLPFKNAKSTTFTGKDFILNTDTSKQIYLLYDVKQKHFAAIKSPGNTYTHYFKSRYSFCPACVLVFYAATGHICPQNIGTRKKLNKKRTCEFCNYDYYNKKKHKCFHYECKSCKGYHKRGFHDHRCILYKEPKRPENKVIWQPGMPEDGKAYKIFAFDLESAFKIVESKEPMIEFETDDENFILEDDKVRVINVYKKAVHTVNLICYKDIYSNEPVQTCTNLEEFVLKMTSEINKGQNICIAHNASGYDSRLIFEEATKFTANVDIQTILRGCKFMRLVIGKTIFQDSLLHIRGTLRSLAHDYASNTNLRKGFFPYLFNSIDNYKYIGKIPDKKYFDLTFGINNKKTLKDFNDWYDSQQDKIWNFQHELVEYCKNDVEVLSEILKSYEKVQIDMHDMSPWFNLTAPSYVHEVFLRNLSKNLNLPENKISDEYNDKINTLAKKGFWAALTEEEYYFAKNALRGGRTDVRSTYYRVSNEDWNKGIRIKYIDVVSLYPYCQIAFDYPVGTPEIFITSNEEFPCRFHTNHSCTCSIEKKKTGVNSKLNIKLVTDNEMFNLINSPIFFGIICVSLEPPKNLFHPVLPLYDDIEKKCLYSLETIKHKTFTSIEFQEAIRQGYKIIKVFRYDQYIRKKSLWAPLLKKLFIEKMRNAEELPSIEEQERLVREYEKDFKMGDIVKKSFTEKDGWGKRPAQKATAKIFLNSGWGKHCERINMGKSLILSENDQETIMELYQNLSAEKLILSDVRKLSDEKTFFKHKNLNIHPDLHKGYITAGLFVPAYGRLVLLEQLTKLGKRVLMHDTDSIVYVYDPNEYNPPESDVLGHWKREDICSKNGGLREFVGLGPKSYGLLAENGKTLVKCKGLSIKMAHEKIFNYNTIVDLVKNKISEINVPQKTFVQAIGDPMYTYNFLKKIMFHKGKGKGIYVENEYKIYPLGYDFINN